MGSLFSLSTHVLKSQTRRVHDRDVVLLLLEAHEDRTGVTDHICIASDAGVNKNAKDGEEETSSADVEGEKSKSTKSETYTNKSSA